MTRKDDYILEAIKDLDLTPTMEMNARDKYKAIAIYLDNNGVESDFYPQGSFLIGTVVKPYRDGKEHDYDLDILSILKKEKHNTTARITKNSIGDCIKASKEYKDKLQKEDANCWTLKYAEVSANVGFSLDIVPSVNEDDIIKSKIISSGVQYKFVDKTLAITQKDNDNYTWKTSNPLGFGDWFLEISSNHITTDMKSEQYNKFSKEFRSIFAKAEEIPNYYYRSNLQRAIQFIKRHRDIYYDRSKLNNIKPSSILVTALVADSVKDDISLGVSDIILKFIRQYKDKKISIMEDNKVFNPVDLNENLIDGYSQIQISKMDSWIDALYDVVKLDILEQELKFKRALHNDINDRAFKEVVQSSEKVENTKPWKAING